MSLFSSRTSRRPRIVPALDDADLARALRQLNKRGAGSGRAPEVTLVATLLEEAGDDWDRRSHRASVLAEATAGTGLASSWLSREPDNADALVFHSWVGVMRGLRDRRGGGGAAPVDQVPPAAGDAPRA